jgi:hypothetical protein
MVIVGHEVLWLETSGEIKLLGGGGYDNSIIANKDITWSNNWDFLGVVSRWRAVAFCLPKLAKNASLSRRGYLWREDGIDQRHPCFCP